MWVQHRHQLRRCWFCGQKHEAGCKVREMVETLQKERDAKRQTEGFAVKTYSSSVLRYANQSALVSDVDAMSGGSTRNLLNAVAADEDNKDILNIVIVGGGNDRRMRLSMEEFVYTLKVIRERVLALNQSRRIFLLPLPVATGLTPEEQVKLDHFSKLLGEIEAGGVVVLNNPVKEYDEDQGSQSSAAQTVTLIKAPRRPI